jgi:hypothetical protein
MKKEAGLLQFADSGGLLSYIPRSLDLWRRVGGYVDKIQGCNPAELPVEQPPASNL